MKNAGGAMRQAWALLYAVGVACQPNPDPAEGGRRAATSASSAAAPQQPTASVPTSAGSASASAPTTADPEGTADAAAEAAADASVLDPQWVGSWKTWATTYFNVVPGGPRPKPIIQRSIAAEIGADGEVRFQVSEFPSRAFQPAGAGASCETRGALHRRGDQWLFTERSTTCIKVFDLPYTHRVSLKMHNDCILSWSVDRGGVAGLDQQVGLIRRDCPLRRAAPRGAKGR
jgi:hypothetical protein